MLSRSDLAEFSAWLMQEKPKVASRRSAENFCSRVKVCIGIFQDAFGKPLCDATQEEINKFLTALETGDIPNTRGREYAPSSVNLTKWALKHYFDWLGKPVVIRVKRRDWTIDEDIPTEREVLARASAADPETRAFVLTLFSTGCRKSEIIGDRKSRVPPISVESLDLESPRPSVVVIGKGGKQRRVWFLLLKDETVDALKSYLQGRTSGILFPNLAYNPLRAWKLVKRLGWHPHLLRHAHATALLVRGVNLKRIQEHLGHARITTTETYTHLIPEEMEELFRKVGL
jgi:integrase/recombinase XerD